MNISDVITYTFSAGWKNWLFVKVCTDEEIYGIKGWDRKANDRNHWICIESKCQGAAGNRKVPRKNKRESAKNNGQLMIKHYK